MVSRSDPACSRTRIAPDVHHRQPSTSIVHWSEKSTGGRMPWSITQAERKVFRGRNEIGLAVLPLAPRRRGAWSGQVL